jgi:hypothetical protein
MIIPDNRCKVLKTISRLSANKYKDPWKKIIDEMLLTQFENLDDKYDGTHHYLYEDAKFLVGRVKISLKKYQGKEGGNGYLDAYDYHGMNLDSSFCLQMAERRRRSFYKRSFQYINERL